MATLRERYLNSKHGKVLSMEEALAQLEEKRIEYETTGVPKGSYKNFCKRHNIRPFPEWVKKACKLRREQDVNADGIPKKDIRKMTRRIFKRLKIKKIKGYEMHHCCGYERGSYDKFIYIPEPFHEKIHQFLEKHGVKSDVPHWNLIRDMVNAYEGYTYIHI